ncbi:MAG: hypothetical protein PHW22_01755 [Bacilli bacterium]|nr:hypothetical protein [Bacilli bacterium]
MKNEIKRAVKIKEEYSSKTERTSKLEELENMNRKVKLPGFIVSISVGSIGILLFGAGLSALLVGNYLVLGLSLGIPGLVLSLIAYPLYKTIINYRKARYASKIIRLSDEIINDGEK